MADNNQTTFKLRTTAIFLVAIGYGWAGGHFIPANAPSLAYLFQAVIILILIVLGIGFFNASYTRDKSKPITGWPINGLTIFTALSLLINIANIIMGASNSGQHTFGSHNTFADLVPICILIIGDVLWLITLLFIKISTKRTIEPA
jgi:hypothetical protein